MIRVHPNRIEACLALLALCAASAGCSASGNASTPVVRIDDTEIPYADFAAYLEASFGGEVPPENDAETRSRLLDQFIEERLLLQAARSSGIRIADGEIDGYLAGLGVGPAAGGRRSDASLREQVRHSLLVQAYKDRVILRDLKVTPEEVEGYFRDHPEEFRESRLVVLRQILLDTPEDAKGILERLREDPTRFQALAEAHSVSPDHGQPRPFQEQELPEAVRSLVFSLEPGQVSDVVNEGGRYRIFQAVNRHDGKDRSLEEARSEIEVLLLRKKAEQAVTEALAGLRRSSRVTVERKALPFRYVGEYAR